MENIFEESNAELLNQIIHASIDEICAYSGTESKQYANVTNEQKKDFEHIYKLFTDILESPAVLSLEKGKMPNEYHQFPEFLQNLFVSCIKVRKDQLCDAITRRISKSIFPTMTDFDWKIKYVSGSSKMALNRQVLIQLDILLSNKEKESKLCLEMTNNELNNFIKVLESII